MAEQTKFALRKLKRMPDGRMTTVFVDAQTGQEVANPSGYQIITAGNQVQGGLPSPSPAEETKEKETTSQAIVKQTTNAGDSGGSDPTPYSGGKGSTASPDNNFGYINKPGFVNALSFAPGMFGMAGKAVNAGINTANLAAVNAARQHYAMPGLGFKDSVRGFVRGPDPYIGQVQTSPTSPQYNVSLNPNKEFGKQYSFSPAEIDFMTADQMNPNTTTFADAIGYDTSNVSFDRPERLGFMDRMAGFKTQQQANAAGPMDRIGGLVSRAGNFFDNLFGGGSGPRQSQMSTGQLGWTTPGWDDNRYTPGPSYGPNDFPDAPSGGGGFTGSPAHGAAGARGGFTSGGSSGGGSDNGGGISQEAQDAVDSGAGGLY